MRLLKYVLNCEQNFSYFELDYPTSGLTVTGLERDYFNFSQSFALLLSGIPWPVNVNSGSNLESSSIFNIFLVLICRFEIHIYTGIFFRKVAYVVGLERSPLNLVRITEELLEWKNSDSGSRKSKLTAVGIRCADHATPSSTKVGTNLADMRRSLGRYS
jgi:hypothetical protein